MFNINTSMAIQEDIEAAQRRARMARALAQGGFEDVHVVDRDTAAALLTEKRQELIEHVRTRDVESVRNLADELDRDVAAVSRDLDVLFEHDVIKYDLEGQRKIPRLKHGAVVAEPIA